MIGGRRGREGRRVLRWRSAGGVCSSFVDGEGRVGEMRECGGFCVGGIARDGRIVVQSPVTW